MLRGRNASDDALRPEDGDWIVNTTTGEIVCDGCLYGAERTMVVPHKPWIRLSAEGRQELRIAEQSTPDGWEMHWPIPLRCHRCSRATLPMPDGHYFERTDYTKVPITEEALDRATTNY